MIVDKFSPSELPQNSSFYLMAGIRAKNGINLQNSKAFGHRGYFMVGECGPIFLHSLRGVAELTRSLRSLVRSRLSQLVKKKSSALTNHEVTSISPKKQSRRQLTLHHNLYKLGE